MTLGRSWNPALCLQTQLSASKGDVLAFLLAYSFSLGWKFFWKSNLSLSFVGTSL